MKRLTLRRFSASLLVLGLLIGLSGCNTMEGVGEDIGAAGDKIDESAERRGAD